MNLAGATRATLSYAIAETGFEGAPDNDTVTVFFSRDGTDFVQVDLINNTTNNATRTIDLTQFGQDRLRRTAVRFVANNLEAGDTVTINNLNIQATVPAATPTVDHSATFTEGGASVPIASLPSITDDGTTIASARIVLTNASTGDQLVIGGLPAGIAGISRRQPGRSPLHSRAQRASPHTRTPSRRSRIRTALKHRLEVTVSSPLRSTTGSSIAISQPQRSKSCQ